MSKTARKPKNEPSRTAGARAPGEGRRLRSSRVRSLWQVLALALFASALYANTIGHDYVLDDDIITRRNAFVQRGAAGLGDTFMHGFLFGFNGANDQSYRPLTLASTAMEVQFFGNKPGMHHLANVLLFTVSVVLLYSFLRDLVARRATPGADTRPQGVADLFPLVAALLFAAHPIHTEVVANIKSRDEILSFLFGILALKSAVRFHDTGAWRASLLGTACYFLSALSKETGLAMLGLVPLTLWFFRKASLKCIGLATLPFVIAAGVYFALRASVMSRMIYGAGITNVINNALQGARSPGEWFASRVMVLGRYVGLLLFPHPLSYDYSYNQIPLVGPGDWRFLVSLAVYLGLIGAAIWGLRSRHPVAYGVWFYLVMLVLVSNLITPVGTTMAERLLFGSSAGFCIALGWLIAGAAAHSARRAPVYAGLAVLLALYGGKTVSRNQDWKNPATLFTSGLRTAPHSARAHNHYASYLRERSEALPPGSPQRAELLREAAKSYRVALGILPSYAEASYNLGVTLYDLGELDSAQACYETTLANDSTYLSALNNLGVIYLGRREYGRAREQWTRALRLNPDYADACVNLAVAFYNQAVELAASGRTAAALEYYRQAARGFERAYAIEPARARLVNSIVSAYAALGDSAAIKRWRAVTHSGGFP